MASGTATAPIESRPRSPATGDGGTGAGGSLAVRWPGAAAVAVVAAFPLAGLIRIALTRPQVVLYGDQALLALGARRAAGFHQLVGPYSRAGFHHPGPALFYLLAPFVNMFGASGSGLYVGALAINAAAMIASVAVVWRSAGPWAALWSAAAIDLFALALGTGTLREPWNPYLAVMPMVLFVVLWATACSGSATSGVWAAVVGSYEIQTHISTAPVVMVLCAAMVVSLVRRREPKPFATGAWAGSGVFLAMWVPPLIDLALDRPSNVTQIWDFFTAGHPSAGAGRLSGVAGDALTVLPFGNHDYVLALHRSGIEVATSAVMVLAAAFIAIRAERPRGSARPALRLLQGAAVLAVVGTASLAGSDGPVYLYFALWLSVVPLLVLIALGTAMMPATLHPHLRRRAVLTAAAFAVAAVAVVSDLGLAPASQTIGSGPWPQRDAASIAGRHRTVTDTAVLDRAALAARTTADRGAVLTIGAPDVWPYAAGVVLQLDEHGTTTTVGPNRWDLYFGTPHAPSRATRAAVLRLGLYPDNLVPSLTNSARVIAGVDGVSLILFDV